MSGKKDCEELMNALLPLAERMLRDHGEFYPYSGYMRPNGEIVLIGAQDTDTERPKSKDMIYVLRTSLAEMASRGKCKAIGIVLDVRVSTPGTGTKSDAIQLCLEHEDGYSAEVFVPYDFRAGGVSYRAMFAQQGKNEIFGVE